MQVLWGIATPSEIVRVSFIGTIYLAIADPKSGKDRTCFFSPLFFVDSTCYFRQVARVYRHEQPAGRPFSDGVHYQRRQARLRQCVRALASQCSIGRWCKVFQVRGQHAIIVPQRRTALRHVRIPVRGVRVSYPLDIQRKRVRARSFSLEYSILC